MTFSAPTSLNKEEAGLLADVNAVGGSEILSQQPLGPLTASGSAHRYDQRRLRGGWGQGAGRNRCDQSLTVHIWGSDAIRVTRR